MASIERRRKKDGKVVYRVKYRDPDHLQRSKTFGKRVDADRFLVMVEADKLRGDYVRPEDGQRLWEDFAAEYS